MWRTGGCPNPSRAPHSYAYVASSPDSRSRCVQFMHVTSCGGTAVEDWGRAHGLLWGRNNPLLHRPRYIHRVVPWRRFPSLERWHVPPEWLRDFDRFRELRHVNSTDQTRGKRVHEGGWWPMRNTSGWAATPYVGAHVFCIVRHPVCRTVSEYRSNYGPGKPKRDGWDKRVGWERWLEHNLNTVGGEDAAAVHSLPIHRWYPCDTFLRYEHLQADFDGFVRRWQLVPPGANTTLPRGARQTHHGRNKDEAVHVTQRQLSRIRHTFSADFDHFGYNLTSIPCGEKARIFFPRA